MLRFTHVHRRWIQVFITALVLASLVGGKPSTLLADGTGVDDRFGAVQAIDAPNQAAEAGVRWERIIFPWALMQPNSPDEMLPTYYSDERIAAQARGGVTQVGVIVYTPTWAAVDPSRSWGAVPRGLDRPHTDSANTWARFVNQLATKYRGTVDHWIVWNEPDLVNLENRVSPTWSGTEQEFWLLQKNAYLAIKQANPSAQVLLPGFSYWHSKELGRPQYLKRLLDVAASDGTAPRNNWYFDAVSVHAYGNPFNSFALPELYRRILAERGLEKKPIWIVEANVVPWDDPVGLIPRQPWRASMDEQASFIIQAFALGLAANVDRMSVYQMIDGQPEDGQYFGLVRADGSPRQAYRAFQTVTRVFDGVKKATLSWDGSDAPINGGELNRLLDSLQPRFQFVCPCQVAQVVLERDDQRITVLWNTRPRPVTGVVRAAGDEATLLTMTGESSVLRARSGELQVYLAGARSDTEPRDGDVRLVGGRPAILVENVGADARSSRPPRVEAVTRYDTGFSVANGPFQTYLERNGGVAALGQPISREIDLLGAPAQIFQRQILQLGEDGSVRALERSALPLVGGSDRPFGELVKAMLTGQGLSDDVEQALGNSPLVRLYDPSQPDGLRASEALPRSNLKHAFEPE